MFDHVCGSQRQREVAMLVPKGECRADVEPPSATPSKSFYTAAATYVNNGENSSFPVLLQTGSVEKPRTNLQIQIALSLIQ